ncbi:hypothetical protein EK0264_02255 [Epidermidibacterium keratini]|uniref:Uncharacterized protein n=1 Tax=Epidermidibacterium keratini TaxID=1891644 RepID=A0A7L4YII9_9ACTN|nr:DUF6506 family protein [Epidermidibacterium keratini]QHB99224.1 hypothetical protein EK0264_02255 [Epidermidibacterium keratini]
MRTVVIYEGPEIDPVDTGEVRIIASPHDLLVQRAIEEYAGGADRIELCGAVGPLPQAAILDAIPTAAVGAVLYGFESLDNIAAYKTAYAAGEKLQDAFLYLDRDAPATGRRQARGDTTFVAVPDSAAAGQVAEELAAGGVTLFELYAGLGPHDAAAVWRGAARVRSDVAVGLATYPSPLA